MERRWKIVEQIDDGCVLSSEYRALDRKRRTKRRTTALNTYATSTTWAITRARRCHRESKLQFQHVMIHSFYRRRFNAHQVGMLSLGQSCHPVVDVDVGVAASPSALTFCISCAIPILSSVVLARSSSHALVVGVVSKSYLRYLTRRRSTIQSVGSSHINFCISGQLRHSVFSTSVIP